MEPRAERIRYLIGGAERGGEYGDVAYSSAPAFFGGASLAVRALIDMMRRQLAILDDAQRSPFAAWRDGEEQAAAPRSLPAVSQVATKK